MQCKLSQGYSYNTALKKIRWREREKRIRSQKQANKTFNFPGDLPDRSSKQIVEGCGVVY